MGNIRRLIVNTLTSLLGFILLCSSTESPYESGDFSAALEAVEPLVGQPTPDVDGASYKFAGQVFNEAHLYHQAIVALDKAIQRDPRHKEAYFQRAIAYFELGDYDTSLFEVTGYIKGKAVTARGIVIDGQLRFGTIFAPE